MALSDEKDVNEDLRKHIEALESANAYGKQALHVFTHSTINTFSISVNLFYSIKKDIEEMPVDQLWKSKTLKLLEDGMTQFRTTTGHVKKFQNWIGRQIKHPDLHAEDININSLFRELERMMKGRIAETGLNLFIEGHFNTVITTDRGALTLILENILTNAIKFSPPSGLIFARFKQQNGEIHFSVQNTGCISDSTIDMLNKGQTITPEKGTAGEKGSGLGLHQTRYYLKRLGGNLTVESTQSEVKLSFSLPIETQFEIDLKPLAETEQFEVARRLDDNSIYKSLLYLSKQIPYLERGSYLRAIQRFFKRTCPLAFYSILKRLFPSLIAPKAHFSMIALKGLFHPVKSNEYRRWYRVIPELQVAIESIPPEKGMERLALNLIFIEGVPAEELRRRTKISKPQLDEYINDGLLMVQRIMQSCTVHMEHYYKQKLSYGLRSEGGENQ